LRASATIHTTMATQVADATRASRRTVWGSTDPAGNGEQKKRRTASDA
jgi:hypothetical protein